MFVVQFFIYIDGQYLARISFKHILFVLTCVHFDKTYWLTNYTTFRVLYIHSYNITNKNSSSHWISLPSQAA